MTDLGLNDIILDIKNHNNYDFVRAEVSKKGKGLISGKGINEKLEVT